MPPANHMSLSALDIDQRKKHVGHELMTVLYLSEEYNEIVIAPYYYVIDPGYYYDQEQAVTLRFDTTPSELGRSAVQALLACDKIDRLWPEPKGSNHPAYKASKARTVKQFRSSYIAICMETTNTSIRVEAYPEARAYLRSGDIYVGAYLSPGEQTHVWGKSIMKIFRCYQHVAPLLA